MTIKAILLSILVSIFSSLSGQETPRYYSELKIALVKDSLLNEFGSNKNFYPKYELACLTALSHYPELKETPITFKRKNIKTTMAARPTGFQVFRRKGKRHYTIYINDFPSAKIHPDSAQFNAQVGVIGHELAHIADYENKSCFKLIMNGLAYFHKGFKRKFERKTDLSAIRHGLRWQCYDYSVFVYQYQHAPKEYIEFKKKIYLSPNEILIKN